MSRKLGSDKLLLEIAHLKIKKKIKRKMKKETKTMMMKSNLVFLITMRRMQSK
jgi:hypothetical protein